MSTVSKSSHPRLKSSHRHLPYIVAFRGYLQLITIAAILAVDFHVFPRRFAKTETFGTSLMDVGVGMFIFSSGLVSGLRLSNDKVNWDYLMKTLRIIFPCILLGFGRMISVKVLDYQEHVSEYGVHWNFFVTLAIIPILVLIQKFILPLNSFLIALLSSASKLPFFVNESVYQYCLKFKGLEDYILNTPRIDFLSQNREGFYSIYLIAFDLGSKLMTHHQKKTMLELRNNRIITLLRYTIFLSAMYFCLTFALQIEVSRRMANFPFVIWVSALCSTMLLSLFLIDDCFSVPNVPIILTSINQNQLAIFLFANILTGLINLTVNTLNFNHLQAFAILIVYLYVVGLVAALLHRWNITLKFNNDINATG
ncbi:Glucosaminyl phosphatidylinositol (GlcN-PI) nositol acylation protein [Globomyces sp. JEL0801]|nr:Glucosaminyl phosphatidylinositol (GlcN-PI) nositol acylation protein [Globomyces sp. JEL0801]